MPIVIPVHLFTVVDGSTGKRVLDSVGAFTVVIGAFRGGWLCIL